MMRSGLFCLLLFTGGNASSSEQQELDDSDLSSNLSMGYMPASVYTENLEPKDFPFIFEQIRASAVNISDHCSFQDVLRHLNLSKNSDLYSLTRPVQHHSHSTWLFLDMKIYAILDVREIDQTLISYIWIYLRWDNEHIWWYPDDFCGLDHILVPAKYLWMPDLTIEEMTEQDKASPSPYLNIKSHGWVEYRNDQVVTSTCKMHVYRFPFDMQSCNISFRSIMYSDEELQLFYKNNNSVITEWTRETMQTQYEWLFVSMSVTNKTVNQFDFKQAMVVYTINMKRRSVLYVANFLLPVLFFLCLDLASILLSDSGGEKVGFKVTVLLAVTVMQLLLNEILPCSSDKIPLIAVFCIGTFTLMLCSLLETILVMYLIEKDATSQDNEPNRNPNLNETKEEEQVEFSGCFRAVQKLHSSASAKVVTPDETSAVAQEGGSNQLAEMSLSFEKLSEELGEIKKTVTLLSSRREDKKSGYWTRDIDISGSPGSHICCAPISHPGFSGFTLMLPTEFLVVLLLTVGGGMASDKVCSYHDVLNYLNLTKANELFSITRPVKDYKKPTEVFLEVLLYAILDVKEIDQTFVPYVWILLVWQNDYINWNPSDFCGIESITLPTEILWKPDLTIEEMTEKDKAPPSPYLTIDNTGKVYVQNDQVLVSTCRMQVYKFPFDVQSCTLSFKSVIHSVDDIRLFHNLNSSVTAEWSRELMRTQYEWLFVDMTVTNKTVSPFGSEQDTIIYTVRNKSSSVIYLTVQLRWRVSVSRLLFEHFFQISMKRRSVLYIVNFLVPVLFFLCLDLTSFMISDRGGEKLSFKVTVLLAVTVMQLILNEILPSSSDRTPLIAIYCIGIFALMMLSLLETILVMYLMEKDSASQDERDENQSVGEHSDESQGRAINLPCCEGEEKKWTQCACICGASAERTPAEPLQDIIGQLTVDSDEKLPYELREVVRLLTLLLQSSKNEGKPGYWTKKIKTINRVYFVFYVTAATLFLVCMFSIWVNGEEQSCTHD
ncbi:LOW QUALITY PROTEIN: uncharacterized protein ACNS7B_022270 [Menidia menidia]